MDYEGQEKSVGGDKTVHFLDYGDSLMSIYIYVKIHKLCILNVKFMFINYVSTKL